MKDLFYLVILLLLAKVVYHPDEVGHVVGLFLAGVHGVTP